MGPVIIPRLIHKSHHVPQETWEPRQEYGQLLPGMAFQLRNETSWIFPFPTASYDIGEMILFRSKYLVFFALRFVRGRIKTAAKKFMQGPPRRTPIIWVKSLGLLFWFLCSRLQQAEVKCLSRCVLIWSSRLLHPCAPRAEFISSATPWHQS